MQDWPRGPGHLSLRRMTDARERVVSRAVFLEGQGYPLPDVLPDWRCAVTGRSVPVHRLPDLPAPDVGLTEADVAAIVPLGR